MPFDPSKILRIEIASALMALPLVIWLALYLTYRWWSLNLGWTLQWLETLRRVSWVFSVILAILSAARDHFPFVYAIAMFTFSAGISMPERWVRRRGLT
jgi:hypothetical protein